MKYLGILFLSWTEVQNSCKIITSSKKCVQSAEEENMGKTHMKTNQKLCIFQLFVDTEYLFKKSPLSIIGQFGNSKFGLSALGQYTWCL